MQQLTSVFFAVIGRRPAALLAEAECVVQLCHLDGVAVVPAFVVNGRALCSTGPAAFAVVAVELVLLDVVLGSVQRAQCSHYRTLGVRSRRLVKQRNPRVEAAPWNRLKKLQCKSLAAMLLFLGLPELRHSRKPLGALLRFLWFAWA